MFESTPKELDEYAKENGFQVVNYKLASHKRKWRTWLITLLILFCFLLGALTGILTW